MQDAFQGITVLEVGTMTPGKFAGFLLAEWGARAVRIERPGAAGGDISNEDLLLNRGKQSMAVNLRAPEGRDILLALARRADVLIESYRPGVTARLGIDYAAVRSVNEGIVYCSLSGFGQDGPDKSRPAFDLVFQAAGGLSHVLGAPGQAPVPTRTFLADAVSGLTTAYAIAAALRQREATGVGTHIDLSMLDAVFNLLAVSHGTLRDDGTSAGDAVEAFAERPAYAMYETADGRYLALGVARSASYRALFDHLGRPELADSDADGPAAEAFLRRALRDKTAAAWEAELAPLDIEVSQVRTPEEAFANPQLIGRGMVLDSEHPMAGRLRQIGRLCTGPDFAPPSPAPAIGADTDALLRDLGHSERAIAALRERGVV